MIKKIIDFLQFKKHEQEKTVQEEIDELFDTLYVDELKISIGEDLLPYSKELSLKIKDLRKKLKEKTGLIIPAVRILDDCDLQENEYRLFIRQNVVFAGFTVPKEDYAINEIIANFEKQCIKNVELVLSNELTEKYMETVQRNNGWLICYLSRLIPTTGIKIILANLIKNGKSIKDINFIFEKICEVATQDRDMYSIRDPYKIAKALNSRL